MRHEVKPEWFDYEFANGERGTVIGIALAKVDGKKRVYMTTEAAHKDATRFRLEVMVSKPKTAWQKTMLFRLIEERTNEATVR